MWNTQHPNKITIKIEPPIYSSSHKSLIFGFAQLILQILVNYQNQGQFWNLLVLRILKLSLEVKFDQDLNELMKVKDKV